MIRYPEEWWAQSNGKPRASGDDPDFFLIKDVLIE